ncbi:hypothetical protein [Nesterenkonia sp. HG001]|uniref:hypothetical protein n=1 Tax=Nesterenkonia sp. HG001 TaxID=2983207 RepID=UPI002AC65E96|nr:hypothetical protein [Nesterenkonia sp. HG001]MDZ5077597.1 hypothetical protein [Nesterenkonia sp. HG001]
MNRNALTLTSLAMASALVLSACGDDGATNSDDEELDPAAQTEDTDGGDGDGDSGEEERIEPSDRETHEAGGPTTRVAVTYDGGVAVLDGATLEVLGEFDVEGFTRVNPAGDGRHFFLTEGESFRLIDGGSWGSPHGDHDHYHTTDPLLTDITVDGPEPGHVVSHDGIGTLFFDGNGEIHSYDLSTLDAETEIDAEVSETDDAHHGVAVVNADGSRFETLADRSGARFLDADGEEVASSEDCPGVHGEAALPDHSLAVGCEDGVLLFDGEEFTKLETGEEFSRIGNLFPHDESPVLLGDYLLDEDRDEPMTSVALVNAETEEIVLADVESPYNFRSLARGPEGEALVMAEDGQLHVIDEETGEHIDQLQVMDEWTEPEEWQQPRPAIRVVDDIAYITEPDAQAIHMVDLTELEIINEAEFDFTPNEIAAVDGRPVEGVSDDFEGEDDEDDHGDHDHDDDDDHDHGDDDHDHDDDDHDHDHEDDEGDH